LSHSGKLKYETFSGRAALTEPELGVLVCRILATDEYDPGLRKGVDALSHSRYIIAHVQYCDTAEKGGH
jgi:hypothetical protein